MLEGVLVGLLVGFVGMAWLSPKLRKRSKETRVAFRSLADEPRPPRTLDEIVAAARSANLRVTAHPSGFAAHEDQRSVTMTVPDATRVTLASMEIVDNATELLVYELALAMVPLFGPLSVTESFGRRLVDGTRDAGALREERSAAIRKMAAGVLADLQDAERTYGGGGAS